jgi:hypothetical protein
MTQSNIAITNYKIAAGCFFSIFSGCFSVFFIVPVYVILMNVCYCGILFSPIFVIVFDSISACIFVLHIIYMAYHSSLQIEALFYNIQIRINIYIENSDISRITL